MSRSEMKRIAVQKGEPMPTFERSRRIVIEEPCEHGAEEAICVFDNVGCPGGSRTVLTEIPFVVPSAQDKLGFRYLPLLEEAGPGNYLVVKVDE